MCAECFIADVLNKPAVFAGPDLRACLKLERNKNRTYRLVFRRQRPSAFWPIHHDLQILPKPNV